MVITTYEGTPGAWATLLGTAKSGGMQTEWAAEGRSVAWRVFLGLLPADEPFSRWGEHAAEGRLRYAAIRARHIPDISTSEGDPLAAALESDDDNRGGAGKGGGGAGSVWKDYYDNSELRDEIQRDLDRLFVDGLELCGKDERHFLEPNRQRTLQSVLYVWSREHSPLPSYRQGMHEVLAILLFALEADAEAASATAAASVSAPSAGSVGRVVVGAVVGGGGDEEEAANRHGESQRALLLRSLCGKACLEADAFALFESVMEELGDWYKVVDTPPLATPRPNHSSNQEGVGLGSARRRGVPNPLASTAREKEEEEQPVSLVLIHEKSVVLKQVLASSQRCQSSLLAVFDPALAKHLDTLSLSPQLYGMRWLRLLFGREYPLPNVLILWDAIFATQALAKYSGDDGGEGANNTPYDYEDDEDDDGDNGDGGLRATVTGEQPPTTTTTTTVTTVQQRRRFCFAKDKPSYVAAAGNEGRVCLKKFSEFVAVAMIRSVRDVILADDDVKRGGSEAMMALMRFKAPCPVSLIVASALIMARYHELLMLNHLNGHSHEGEHDYGENGEYNEDEDGLLVRSGNGRDGGGRETSSPQSASIAVSASASSSSAAASAAAAVPSWLLQSVSGPVSRMFVSSAPPGPAGGGGRSTTSSVSTSSSSSSISGNSVSGTSVFSPVSSSVPTSSSKKGPSSLTSSPPREMSQKQKLLQQGQEDGEDDEEDEEEEEEELQSLAAAVHNALSVLYQSSGNWVGGESQDGGGGCGGGAFKEDGGGDDGGAPALAQTDHADIGSGAAAAFSDLETVEALLLQMSEKKRKQKKTNSPAYASFSALSLKGKATKADGTKNGGSAVTDCRSSAANVVTGVEWQCKPAAGNVASFEPQERQPKEQRNVTEKRSTNDAWVGGAGFSFDDDEDDDADEDDDNEKDKNRVEGKQVDQPQAATIGVNIIAIERQEDALVLNSTTKMVSPESQLPPEPLRSAAANNAEVVPTAENDRGTGATASSTSTSTSALVEADTLFDVVGATAAASLPPLPSPFADLFGDRNSSGKEEDDAATMLASVFTSKTTSAIEVPSPATASSASMRVASLTSLLAPGMGEEERRAAAKIKADNLFG